MNITDIKIRSITNEGRMKAVVSVTFDNEIVVHDMKIIDGPDRYFLAMPSRKTHENSFRDIVHPINPLVREALEKAVIDLYLEQLAAVPATETEAPAADL